MFIPLLHKQRVEYDCADQHGGRECVYRGHDEAVRVAGEHKEHPGAIWTDGPRLEAGEGEPSSTLTEATGPHRTISHTIDEHHGGTDPEAGPLRPGLPAAEGGPFCVYPPAGGASAFIWARTRRPTTRSGMLLCGDPTTWPQAMVGKIGRAHV